MSSNGGRTRLHQNSQVAAFSFDAAAVGSAEEPKENNIRLFWLFVTLLNDRAASYAAYARSFERDERTWKRDVKKLRTIGRLYGFELTQIRGGTVGLKAFKAERRLPEAPDAGADALRALAEAFGDIVAASIGEAVELGFATADRFLRVAIPRPSLDSEVGATYRILREAWKRQARVRFRYPSRDGGPVRERIAEPYAVTFSAGRYYLVAFDIRPKSGGWRQFALDRIVGNIARAGTFARRPIPAAYRGEDALGLFKTGAQTVTEVAITVSALIADAVVARTWQRGQRVTRGADRSATFTFAVYDVDEAVRWALGFGPEARIVAPPRAVERARALTQKLAERYAAATLDEAVETA